jgi:HSP20 family protein
MTMDDAESKSAISKRKPPGATHFPRNIAEFLSGWPFEDLGWFPRGSEAMAGVPIKVEEFTEGDQIVIRAELPGVDPERDVDVSVEDGVLTIKAERREEKQDKTESGYRSEFRYGSFVRQIRLPKGTGPDVISATYRDGVLEIRMPKPAEDTPRQRIQISRG